LSARAFNPLSVNALFAQALVERNARSADAVPEGRRPEPKNAETWYEPAPSS
jgi:hypothetical protein